MESKQKNNNIIIELTKEEVIVFFDWLCRFNEKGYSDLFEDQSEERVLWDMESSIEKVITESFDDNYNIILSKAREKIRD